MLTNHNKSTLIEVLTLQNACGTHGMCRRWDLGQLLSLDNVCSTCGGSPVMEYSIGCT